MGNVNSWHVALSLTFVVGFLMTVVIEAWRNTGMVPVGHSIRFAASRIPWASSGSTESTIRRHAASHDRSFIPYDDAPAARPAAHSHHGSWVIATAAFLLIAFRQTDVFPTYPWSQSSTFHSGRRRLPVASHPRDGTAVLVSHWRARARPVHLRIGRPIRLRRPDERPTIAPDLEQLVIVEMLLIVVVLFCFSVIHDYGGLTRVIKGLIAGAVVSAAIALLGSVTGSADTRIRIPGLVNQVPLNFSADDLVRQGMVRGQGSASHPLELACILSVIFPLALGLVLSLRAAGKRWWPWAAATGIILGGTAVTLSRSGVVGVVVAFAVMAGFWPIRRTLTVLAGIGCLAMVGSSSGVSG